MESRSLSELTVLSGRPQGPPGTVGRLGQGGNPPGAGLGRSFGRGEHMGPLAIQGPIGPGGRDSAPDSNRGSSAPSAGPGHRVAWALLQGGLAQCNMALDGSV